MSPCLAHDAPRQAGRGAREWGVDGEDPTRVIAPAWLRGLSVVATVIAWPASAADFRALDFGSPCDAIQSFEESQGSVPIPGDTLTGGELIAFRGRAFERDVSIVYLCIQGRLAAGHHLLPAEEFERVVKSFGEIRAALAAVHGDPFLDTSPRTVNVDATKYVAAWRTPRVRISLSLVPQRKGPSPDWQVFVMTSAAR